MDTQVAASFLARDHTIAGDPTPAKKPIRTERTRNIHTIVESIATNSIEHQSIEDSIERQRNQYQQWQKQFQAKKRKIKSKLVYNNDHPLYIESFFSEDSQRRSNVLPTARAGNTRYTMKIKSSPEAAV